VIKVLIADDHKMFRQGLRMLLEMEPDIKVVGEASNGHEVQDLAEQLQPDVVLMDINMPPSINGIEATRQLLSRCPEMAIIVLTMFREDEHIFGAIMAGARGYVLKDADTLEVTRAIRTVADGGSIVDAAMTAKLFHRFRTMQDDTSKPRLSEREIEILTLIAGGASNREIGDRLYLSEKTIKNHITSIFQKLQTTDRTQAAVYAIQHGLIRDHVKN
jgi:DNA-binding NarL/FixJ family response regulator